MKDSSESDSSSSDDDSHPDTDRRRSKDRSRSKQQSKRHKKNSHKGKPCYERQHSSDKPTEKSRHDDQDYESVLILKKHRNIWNNAATEMKKKKYIVISRLQDLKARISLSREVMF